MGMTMFCCVFVPNFSVQAALRLEPNATRPVLLQSPVAILDGPDSVLRVFASNERATQLGIQIGMTKAQAEQCLGIILRKRVLADEEAAQAALLDSTSAFSPSVEDTVQGAVTLDIAGTERAFGPPAKLAQEIADAAKQVGLDVNVAVAANADAALVAAKGCHGIDVIPTGGEAERLAELPLDVLSPTPEQAEIFESWGIRRCGDLAALPAVPLVERLGQTGLHLQQLARGVVVRTLVPTVAPMQLLESFELEDAVTDLESLAFILNRLLEQLTRRLMARTLAAEEISLRLDLEIHSDRDIHKESARPEDATFERVLKFPVPMQDARTLRKLIQLDLAAHNPSAPVKRVTLEAKPTRCRYTQAGLFTPLAPEPERLEVTLARLRAVVGEADEQGRSRVGSPELRDSHRADNFRVVAFNPQQDIATAHKQFNDTAVALRMFRPPVPARVRCRENKPVSVSFATLSANVLSASGPWAGSGSWWNTTQKWQREEWDVAAQLPTGIGLYRLFRDLQQGAWFVEGLYD